MGVPGAAAATRRKASAETPRLPRVQLDSLERVRREMARLYTEAKHGQRPAQDASRLANILALIGRIGGALLGIEPDLGVCMSGRRQRFGQPQRMIVCRAMQRRLLRQRGADHVAVHVAARSNRGEPGSVHMLDRALQVALSHAVQLNGLTRRQPDGTARRPTLRDLVHGEPLRRREHAARHANAHHEPVVGLELRRGPREAGIYLCRLAFGQGSQLADGLETPGAFLLSGEPDGFDLAVTRFSGRPAPRHPRGSR